MWKASCCCRFGRCTSSAIYHRPTIVVGNSQSHFEIAVVDSAKNDRCGGFDWLHHAERQPWHHHISLIESKPHDGKFPKIQVQPSSVNTWRWQSLRSFYFSRATCESFVAYVPRNPCQPIIRDNEANFLFWLIDVNCKCKRFQRTAWVSACLEEKTTKFDWKVRWDKNPVERIHNRKQSSEWWQRICAYLMP